MAEPLKNIFSRRLMEPFATELKSVYPIFRSEAFFAELFDHQWEHLELKQRIRRISEVLRRYLPAEYPKALEILVQTTERYLQLHGEKLTFEYLFLPDFVETHGVNYPEASIPALETITRWSSAEFAVRPFLLHYPEQMYRQMLEWSKHPSPMVRRLSSEGIRPRLPWGMGVPALKRDPSPIFPILENLKNDPAETVRRSVANNLNDIAKDHPEQVLAIAEGWLGNNPETDWIVRHACRGLLKKGNAAALAHFGFEKGIAGIQVENLRCTLSVPVGGRLDFSFSLQNQSEASVSVRLEYGIDYQTLSGKTSVKVFKIKELKLSPGQALPVEKYQRFQDFTTRKHFAGTHKLTILVNGASMAQCSFEVIEK
jgi:3-methyladenine DNA glycosylase AlkC